MLFKRKWLFLIMLLSLLTACTGTLEEETEKAKEQAVEVFEAKAKNANVEKETLSLYLPHGIEVDETDPNNVILTRGDKLYLLFINPNEDEKSQVVYEATAETGEDYLLNETFQSDDRFGYIVLKEVEEDVYELTVGIGGIKLTTETNKKDLADDAGMMMEIVSSVQLQNG
ncbi:hypothetical protein [Fervidibacillus halotolerans]|uniref:Lipoprotein n=1 Tax=Fervidibacillus halotolerans TaxID=2980027 RepID=A0A9E8LY70_9BACI|nr:hypothetical protein [Fervidibacillus halotolerans]WAA11749.1 hypothetical protein OE105_08965 [Fervidibacillus halotolerans]